MKKIKYSPDAAEKLRALNISISSQYGKDKAKKIVGEIMNGIRGLLDNENMGISAQGMFGVPCNYRYIFVSRNYVFYSIEDNYIRIVNIYNEKEDFIWQLFGIDTTPRETIDDWGE